MWNDSERHFGREEVHRALASGVTWNSQCTGAKPTRRVCGLGARHASCASQVLIYGIFTGVSCEVGPDFSYLERRKARAGLRPLLPRFPTWLPWHHLATLIILPSTWI